MQEPQLCRTLQSWATPLEMRPGLATFPSLALTPTALYTTPLSLASTTAPGMSYMAFNTIYAICTIQKKADELSGIPKMPSACT